MWRYNYFRSKALTENKKCFVCTREEKLHMVFDSRSRAEIHLKVCDGKYHEGKCNDIWEMVINK